LIRERDELLSEVKTLRTRVSCTMEANHANHSGITGLGFLITSLQMQERAEASASEIPGLDRGESDYRFPGDGGVESCCTCACRLEVRCRHPAEPRPRDAAVWPCWARRLRDGRLMPWRHACKGPVPLPAYNASARRLPPAWPHSTRLKRFPVSLLTARSLQAIVHSAYRAGRLRVRIRPLGHAKRQASGPRQGAGDGL
jgi:hypothetical protein